MTASLNRLARSRPKPVTDSAWLYLGVILLVGALLRFIALDGWSLWTDELYTWQLLPVSTLLANGVPADQHPPLYYMILEQWLVLGDSEWLMRLPSAVSGWLALLIAYRLGVILGGTRMGLWAAALLAVAPLHVWYSREARMYGLATFFWLVSIYFYVQLLLRNSRLDAIGLAAANVAALYTAYPSLALWIGQLALFLFFWHRSGQDRRKLWRWLISQLFVVIGLLVWWPFLQAQLERGTEFHWLGRAITLQDTLTLAAAAAALLLIAVIGFSMLLIRRPVNTRSIIRWAYPFAVFTILVFVLLTGLAATGRALSLRRQLLVFWIPSVFVAAWALTQMRNRWISPVVVGLSLAATLLSAFGPAYEDWRGAVQHIEIMAEPGDQVLVTPFWSTVAFNYYGRTDLPYKGTTPIVLEREPPPAGQRVWLVSNAHPTLSELTVPIQSWFDQHRQRHALFRFPRYITVQSYFGR